MDDSDRTLEDAGNPKRRLATTNIEVETHRRRVPSRRNNCGEVHIRGWRRRNLWFHTILARRREKAVMRYSFYPNDVFVLFHPIRPRLLLLNNIRGICAEAIQVRFLAGSPAGEFRHLLSVAKLSALL